MRDAQVIGHLAPTETIGLLLQYLISERIQKSTGKTVYYIFLKMLMMFMICYLCLYNSQSHNKMWHHIEYCIRILH